MNFGGIFMKKLNFSLVLVTLAFLNFGCGKKNTTNSDSNGSTVSNPIAGPAYYTPNSGVNLTVDQFRSQVASGAFAAKVSSTEIYNYFGYTGSSSNYSSSTCLLIFTCYSYNSGSTSGSNMTFFTREWGPTNIKHPFCNSGGACTSTEPIRQRLTEIVSQAYDISPVSTSRFQVRTWTGYTYVIDVGYPIVANPIARAASDGSYYELNNVTKF